MSSGQPDMMRAVQVTAPGRAECVEIRRPEPKAGEALIRTELASTCGSDLHIIYYGWNASSWPLPPGYPGHEGIGVVVDGSGTRFKEGDRVLTVPHIWFSFGFAGYQTVADRYMLRIPNEARSDHALMAQQLGTVIFAGKRLPSLFGKTCAVMGQGSAGLFWNFILKRLGAERVIAIEPVADRRKLGQLYGADIVIGLTGSAATAAVLEVTGGRGADLVIEAIGSTDTLSQSFDLVCDEGQVVLFGLPESEEPVPFRFDAFFRKRASAFTVLGSQEEPELASYRQALDWIIRGAIDVGPIVTHTIPVTSAQTAFDLAQNKADGVVKVAMTFH